MNTTKPPIPGAHCRVLATAGNKANYALRLFLLLMLAKAYGGESKARLARLEDIARAPLPERKQPRALRRKAQCLDPIAEGSQLLTNLFDRGPSKT